MEGAGAGLRIAAFQSAQKYCDEPSFKAKAGEAFEAAGYPANAVDAEAFTRSLITLASIERMIASAEKRLLSTMKELERRYAARAPETPVNPLPEAICVQKKRKENKK